MLRYFYHLNSQDCSRSHDPPPPARFFRAGGLAFTGDFTDYSSVYFDYLLLDRPIIFLNADADIYASERGFLLEPLEQWTPGVAVCHTKELQLEISSILSGKDDFKEKRKWVCDQVHQYQDAFSSKRILEMMQNMINSLNYKK